MEEKKNGTTALKGKVYPKQLFLTRDKNGGYHWYDKDPMRIPNREDEELMSIEEIITNFVGTGDVTNPVGVYINCCKIVRSEAFNISQPANIRQGIENKHFEDLEGSVVDVLAVRNSDPEYPLNGVVFDRRGNVVENRTYNLAGFCKDGNEDHSLIAINGEAVFDSDEGYSPDGKVR